MNPSEKKPKAVTAVTSMSALIVGPGARREVRVPKKEELPANVAWIRRQDEEPTPAVIAVTGRVIAVMEDDDRIVAQWSLACFPNDSRAHARMSQPDMQELANDLHRELTRIGVMPGAWYTAVFSVPMNGGENFFDATFECAGVANRNERARIQNSWNPIPSILYAIGVIKPIPDPWLEDEGRFAKVHATIRCYAARILGSVWDSWVKNPDVKPALRMLNVPVDDARQTEYRQEGVYQRILRNLPPISQRTMFLAEIPPNFEAEIARKLGQRR